jgi:hypothetical protein
MARPAQTSPSAEAISVATITNGALTVHPMPTLATVSWHKAQKPHVEAER